MKFTLQRSENENEIKNYISDFTHLRMTKRRTNTLRQGRDSRNLCWRITSIVTTSSTDAFNTSMTLPRPSFVGGWQIVGPRFMTRARRVVQWGYKRSGLCIGVESVLVTSKNTNRGIVRYPWLQCRKSLFQWLFRAKRKNIKSSSAGLASIKLRSWPMRG